MPTGIYIHKPCSEERKLKISLAQRGRVFTEEQKRNMSISHTGKKLSIEHRKAQSDGQIKISRVPPSNLGKHHSERTKKEIGLGNLGKVISLETRKKQSESHKGKKRPDQTGEKHHNWKGGVTPLHNKIRSSLEYKIWQDSVLNLCFNCCKKCGERRVSLLTAHHIKNFAQFIELRFALDNGITFCRPCHKEFHKIYGKKNNNYEQVKEFLTEI